jgi:glycosyltransferase involved in cell wall biosynthesis
LKSRIDSGDLLNATHVTHVVPALFGAKGGITGGAERYVYELARHMADRVPTSLVTFGDGDSDQQHGRLRVRIIGRPWHVKGQRSNPFATTLLCEVARARVVHCHQQHIVASTAAALTARLLGRRVVCTDLGGGGFDLSAYVSTDWLYHAHLHISEYSRRISGHEGRSSASVIWGGVDTDRFSPKPDIVRDAVLFVGRILPHKGVDALIQALPAYLPAYIVGPAHDQRYLSDLRRMATDKRVSFHHDWSDDQLVEAYRRALCVVLPSVYDDMYGGHTDVPELLGQTLLEGMACGAPAVCTDVASLPEIVRDGDTGFIVQPRRIDAMRDVFERLARNRALVCRLGQAAAQDVRSRFTWPGVVDSCLRAYRS